MNALTKLILIPVYPLLLLARLLNALLDRDPLRLRDPNGKTYWIERGPEAGRASYFSEVSEQEGRDHGGCGWLATRVLSFVARFFAPAHVMADAEYREAADRDQNIPDEVYTLW